MKNNPLKEQRKFAYEWCNIQMVVSYPEIGDIVVLLGAHYELLKNN